MRPSIAAVILGFIPWTVCGQTSFGQTSFGQRSGAPAFEVATIKASASKDRMVHKERLLPGGQLELPNASLKDLIKGAYSVQDDRITGGPAWLDSDRFDIVAKAPAGTPLPTLFLML